MPQDLILGPIQPHASRHQDDGFPVGRQKVRYVAHSTFVVIQMLNHVHTDDRVELHRSGAEFLNAIQVQQGDAQAGLTRFEFFEHFDIEGIDVGCVVALADHELAGDVPDAGPDFQHIMADVRVDRLGHPMIEVLGAAHAEQDLALERFIRENIVRVPEPDDGPNRFDSVFPVDFFTFVIGSAGIADGHFEDFGLALGQLDGQLRFDPEIIALQRDALQQVRTDSLIAGFHIGKVEIRGPVAQECDQLVAQFVPKHQHSSELGRCKT